ncbi:MAG TPA: DUF6531 domain-containing protein, partial [Verrucomicrobiae bacterium]|nr:DUF6531 domain-containing protein [Verrucomicrobiae bacterium]
MHLPILPAAKRALLRACALVVLISFVTGIDAVAEQGPPLQISISAPGISNEFSATPALSWTADAGVSYLIQVSTNIADPSAWQDADMTAASAAGPVKWMAPESLRDTKFYRLVTSPAVFDVQPAFISSDDTNAWLYLVGQMLPSDGFVSINGHNFGMQHDSTGNSGDVWRISLNGLPLGEPISGAIIVLDAASNVVATLPLQSSIVYGTEMPAEQLQGPPDAPPACPARKEFKGHVTLMKAFDDDAGDEMMSARGHTKSGHVTLMKAFDDGSEDEAAERGLPVIVKPPPHCPAAFFGGGGGGSFDESGASIERRLPITNLGSSGQDGVDIQLRRLPGGNLGSSGQDGVVDFSGESRLQVTDLAIPGAAMDFEWTRSYRSRTGPTTSQGSGWDFSYNVSLSENSDGTVTLHPGNGRADTFYPAGTNGWFRDEYFCQIIDLNGDGYPDVLFADSSRWLFNPLATGGTAGKLAQIIDRNGNTMSLNYDAKGRLIEIVDDLGRTNTVSYNISGQISGVTDFSGRTVSYEYDANGDLVSVISPPVASTPTGDDFPNGITNRYTYTSGNTDERLNHNLATCVDGKGQSWLQITYQATTDSSSVDFDRVDSVRTYKSGG